LDLKVLDTIAKPEMWHIGSSKEAARSIGMTDFALHNHLIRIYRKLGLRNEVQAIMYKLLIIDGRKKRSDGLLEKELTPREHALLSPREEEVRQMLVDESITRVSEIADRLGIALQTTKGLASNVYRKLGVSGRKELMLAASQIKEEQGDPEKVIRPRWIQIYDLMAKGICISDIGHLLHISVNTVKYHIQNVRKRPDYKSDMHVIKSLIESGQISKEELEREHSLDSYSMLNEESREVVDYLRDSDNWGKTDKKMAPDFDLTVNGFKRRLRLIYHELDLTDKIQLEVFAHLLNIEGVPVVPAVHTRRALAGSHIPHS